MIKAIVFKSNSGFTKQYAEIMSERFGLPCYDIKDIKNKLQPQDEIIYLGWIMAGKIQGLSKVKKYCLVAVVGVGMGVPTEKVLNDLYKQNQFDGKMFYLQGGFNFSALHGIYKFMMNFVMKMNSKNNNMSDEEKEFMSNVKEGFNCVSKENLNEIYTFIDKRSL